jgi:uncharacterized membrane protein YgcG
VAGVRRAIAVAIVILTFGTSAAVGQPAPPALSGTVNDFARVIDASSARELDRRIQALRAASGDVVVVATVQTFQPYADIRDNTLRRSFPSNVTAKMFGFKEYKYFEAPPDAQKLPKVDFKR